MLQGNEITASFRNGLHFFLISRIIHIWHKNMNTQELLNTLEEVIESRNRWYTPIEYSWEFLINAAPKYLYFFPKEIAETVPLDDSQKEKAEKARKWYRYHITEKDDDLVGMYEFYKSWPELKGEPFRVMYKRGFVDSCLTGWNREGSLQLGVEMKLLDHVLFLSDEMAESYIKKACPLLSSCIERWKVLRSLKEDLRIYNT